MCRRLWRSCTPTSRATARRSFRSGGGACTQKPPRMTGRDHMIHNEVALLASLRHPRLVRLLRSHHTHAHVYMLMELVTGGDLFDAIARNVKFSEVCAAGMVRDISEGLKFIHNRRIAHRDIKPENLLRHGDSCITLKLADFGLALLVTEPLFTICGTPTYVAPEILAETGECYGVAVDVWAMGVILYVLLCGFPPFRSAERNQTELFRLIRAGELHFFSPYWDMVSTGAKDLIRALLQVNPKGRLTATQTLQHDWLRSFCRTMLSVVLYLHLRHLANALTTCFQVTINEVVSSGSLGPPTMNTIFLFTLL
uniref:Doublecortin-like kinase 3 n=1 Tax=Denticeps clupeoides TaxID=299321 RepID=A0AAY4CK16_9TELE